MKDDFSELLASIKEAGVFTCSRDRAVDWSCASLRGLIPEERR